jgi:hypothetical protein
VIALIDDVDVIKKILQHLDLWETRNHDPPPGKVLLEFVPDQAQHLEQLTFKASLINYRPGICEGVHKINVNLNTIKTFKTPGAAKRPDRVR